MKNSVYVKFTAIIVAVSYMKKQESVWPYIDFFFAPKFWEKRHLTGGGGENYFDENM